MSPQVELEGKTIECRPDVVEGVPQDQRNVWIERFDLSDVKLVCQAIDMRLGRNGPSLVITAPLECFEGSIVVDCPPQLGYGGVQ